MPLFRERARAKINLTLTVNGRRTDGYHDLLSLVAFADAGDTVTLDTGAPTGTTVTGPFASAIEGPNLVETALGRVAELVPGLTIGHVSIEKNLPVASGMGGGSSDAAAALRAIRSAHPAETAGLDWNDLCAGLGADVPVCFAGEATWMSGTGARLHPLTLPLPKLDAVLINPGETIPSDKTARVFRALAAPPLNEGSTAHAALPALHDREALLAVMRRTGNDLESPATAVIPAIDEVLSALEACPDAMLARLSGAGPTCFAIFDGAAAAQSAAAALKSAHPSWWIVPAVLQ
ncbi:MAG: 4-(cytidine 5'-diphospho)-2-C-methyl-D-erythritol kinase [Deltaproteobacteria bacterium]